MSKENGQKPELKLLDKGVKNQEKQKNKIKRDLNFVPHPNMIFAVIHQKGKTESGIILPEQAEDKTPVGEIISVGTNISQYKKGQIVYLVPEYMRFCEIDGQNCVVTFEDGIFGHMPQAEEK